MVAGFIEQLLWGSQEGSGPCMFCGAVVCTAEEEEWLMKDSKKAIKFKEQFLKKHRIEVSWLYQLLLVIRSLPYIESLGTQMQLHACGMLCQA